MARRFVDLGRYKQAWRKLDSKTFRMFYYMWDQADPAGVYLIDKDQFKLDCGFAFDAARLADLNCEGTTAVHELPGGRILLVDFLIDNYGGLKEGYNPHKPAFRAVEKNKLTLNSSLNQACFKLEEEDKEEGEDNISGKEQARVNGTPVPPKDERFEALWVAYERDGSKGKALEYWKQLPEEDRAAIEAKVRAYIASTPGGSYRYNLEGWINPKERRWEKPIKKHGANQMQAALHSADVPPDAYQE